ncbi:MAG: hypothetical protein AMXMBFR84_35650 [Candidatus Hydrogenedentota bacterium]
MSSKRVSTVFVMSALVLAFTIPMFAQSGATYAADQSGATYIGNAQCKVCHNKKAEGEQWNIWKAENHSKAIERLKTPEAIEVGKKVGLAKPPHEAPECLKCHVTAYDPATGKTPDAIKLEDSVQCESCHGPASLHQADGKKVLFQKDKTVDITAHIKKGTKEDCTGCHNDSSPTWKPDRYTLESGEKVGFDFEQAAKKIAHPNPTKAKP